MISRLIGLIYENIAKMANKIFNVPNHLLMSKAIVRTLLFYKKNSDPP